MKCLIIHASYRKGNTYQVSKLLKSYMQTNGHVEYEELFLSKLNLPFCIGCNRCFLKGEDVCPHRSIIQPIVEKIIHCDGLIIATPTYSLQVPGLLKCWLDHMSYHFHRPSFFNKKALVITTTAGGGAKSTGRYIKKVLECWGINHVHLLPLRCFSFSYIPSKEDLGQISLAADVFYAEVASKKLHTPSMERLFLFNLWRSMATSGKESSTADFAYWSSLNLLDEPYLPEIPLGFFKKTWAKFSYRFARKILK